MTYFENLNVRISQQLSRCEHLDTRFLPQFTQHLVSDFLIKWEAK